MENLCLKVIETSSSNAELLLDYWQFRDNLKFSYTIKELTNKYAVISSYELSKTVHNAGFLEVKKLKDCNLCYAKFEIHDRAFFKHLQSHFLKDKILCVECEKIRILKKTEKLISELKRGLPIRDEFKDLKKLTYLENIYLYILIEDYIQNIKIVKNWNYHQVLSTSSGEGLIENIIQKGYMEVIKGSYELNLKQAKLRSILMKHSNYLESHLINQVWEILKLSFDYQIKIIIPKEFKNLEEWIIELFNIIQMHKLSYNDIKEIEAFILNKRRIDVGILINDIAVNKHIPIDKNKSYEFELERLSREYNLEVIHNILAYQATQTAAYLYQIEHSKDTSSDFIKSRVYIKNIEHFLNRVKRYENSTLYTKTLPLDWVDSHLELFMANYIIKNNQKWHKFTPDEILALWVESVGMQNDEENI